ncbi:copper resistance protein CopC [Mycobacterium lentiflavum]|uniref:Copper resistance protein CopC n=1 Tax=Mycobacterium lentiflavum TaxID=141349 RepID=A0A0E4H350_MYCLN|nr:copper resistance protein CopC [Mycobacterium lentiflavum]
MVATGSHGEPRSKPARSRSADEVGGLGNVLRYIEQVIGQIGALRFNVWVKHSPAQGVSRRQTGAVTTWLRRLIAGAGVAAALAVAGVGAGVAWAHPTLVSADPASQSTVSVSPASITLFFNEAVTCAPDAITLLDGSGRQVPVGAARSERDGTAMTTKPQRPLVPGVYTVRWRVTGSDGDETEEEFSFAVGVTGTPGLGRRANTGPDWDTGLLRWLLLTGLAIAVGSLVAQRATDAVRQEQPALPRLPSWVPAGVALAMVAVIGLLIQRVSDAGAFAAVWQGRAGAVLLVQGAGLVTAAAFAKFGRWALAPLAIVIAAEGIRSHATINHGLWGAVLVSVHLAAVTVWVGALLHTTRAVLAWRHQRVAARSVMTCYVRIALWSYLLVVATGILTALAVVSLPQLISTTYGRVLLIKLTLVAAASLTALAGRLIHRENMRISLLGNIIRVETGLLAAVLATSALLISTPPPSGQAHLTEPQPASPPRHEPVVPVATSPTADAPRKPPASKIALRETILWARSDG